MNNFFPFSLNKLKKYKEKCIFFCICLFVTITFLEILFLLIQNRKNSLIFFILMLVFAVLLALIEIYFLSFLFPLLNQLIYLAKRNEMSCDLTMGNFIKTEKNVILRYIEVKEFVFEENSVNVTYYVLSNYSKHELKEGVSYRIYHANQFIFKVEEYNNEDN